MRHHPLSLAGGGLEVRIRPDPGYLLGSPAGGCRHGGEIAVDGRRGQATGVEVFRAGERLASAVLVCPDGYAEVDGTRAVLRDHTLYVALADRIIALALPSLDVRWMQVADDASVFDLLEIAGEDALIVHGELEITRLGFDGRIHWRRGGRDIFTGGCRIEGDAVVAVDWNGWEYRFRLSDGADVAEPRPAAASGDVE